MVIHVRTMARERTRAESETFGILVVHIPTPLLSKQTCKVKMKEKRKTGNILDKTMSKKLVQVYASIFEIISSQ